MPLHRVLFPFTPRILALSKRGLPIKAIVRQILPPLMWKGLRTLRLYADGHMSVRRAHKKWLGQEIIVSEPELFIISKIVKQFRA